jgi:hypothetical protein
MKIELKHSIPVKQESGNEIETNVLILQRLKLKHIKLLPDSCFESDGKLSPKEIVPLIAAITGISEESADEIDLEDLENLSEKLSSSLEEYLPTGKN